MSRPITSEYNVAMQEFTNLSYTKTEQHKESTEARKKRDVVDLEEINSKLEACTFLARSFIEERCHWRCG